MRDNGSSFEIAEKIKQSAKDQDFPEVIEIITGNLFPQKKALSFRNDINGELQRRFPLYIVKNESDVTLFAGMIKIKSTKIN